MPIHQTISPVEATARAIDALLAALAGNPSAGAAAAYRAALARHGRALHAEAGPEALAAVLARIRANAPGRAQAQEREQIVREAWSDLLASQEAA